VSVRCLPQALDYERFRNKQTLIRLVFWSRGFSPDWCAAGRGPGSLTSVPVRVLPMVVVVMAPTTRHSAQHYYRFPAWARIKSEYRLDIVGTSALRWSSA
jgi:hypothetical protein